MLPLHKISATLIAYNSETTLDAVLSSLTSICDEIILVDSGSTDRTIQIAEKYNCKIYKREFTGYGNQKRYAVSLASHDWILSLDADEVLTTEIQKEIFEYFNKPIISYNGFYLPISLVFMGKNFRYGAESRALNLRLFNKQQGGFNTLIVHEKIEVKGKTTALKNEVLHYSYIDTAHYFDKFNKYSTAAAKGKSERTAMALIAKIVFIGPWKIFQGYVIKMNFLNGFPGFVWSLFSAYYSVVKYVKIYEENGKQ